MKVISSTQAVGFLHLHPLSPVLSKQGRALGTWPLTPMAAHGCAGFSFTCDGSSPHGHKRGDPHILSSHVCSPPASAYSGTMPTWELPPTALHTHKKKSQASCQRWSKKIGRPYWLVLRCWEEIICHDDKCVNVEWQVKITLWECSCLWEVNSERVALDLQTIKVNWIKVCASQNINRMRLPDKLWLEFVMQCKSHYRMCVVPCHFLSASRYTRRRYSALRFGWND